MAPDPRLLLRQTQPCRPLPTTHAAKTALSSLLRSRFRRRRSQASHLHYYRGDFGLGVGSCAGLSWRGLSCCSCRILFCIKKVFRLYKTDEAKRKVAGRCAESLHKTIQEIKLEHGDAQLKAFQVDLSSLQSIMKFETSFKQWLLDSDLHPSVQLLINNAGILATSARLTVDGYDQMIQTNYISAVVLTCLLLPLIKNSPSPSRIVNVTSFTHRCASNLKLDRKKFSLMEISKKYPFASIYEYSKLCLLLFSYELHRQLHAENPSSKVSVIPVDPGVVQTNILREVPLCLSQLAFRVLSFLQVLQSPEVGVSSIIDAALAPSNVSGEYFFGGKGRRMSSSSLSYNAKVSAELWLNTSIIQEQINLLRSPIS
ncbi:hypothetical protein M5K25_008060 [Dendrobium thyrsiflorum]|uniref:Uncharacterized protein n=1 Tax=Dendrobium thyrsiflorum TaxID=117978 RepID=A0ABD0V7H1_DENTH